MHAIPPRQEILPCVIISHLLLFGQELHRIHQCIENNLLVNMACFKKKNKKKEKKTTLPLNERLGGVCDRVQFLVFT